MQNRMDNAAPDWTLIRAFLAVAETGSLSAGARVLGTSQPNLGRQVRALESALAVELFHRQPRGLALTAAGERLLPHARAMRDAAGALALSAAGEDARLAGTVRITASVVMSVFHLPPLIAALRREEPRIEIELVPSDTTSNLHFREADIALRMFRPTQLDLVTRHLGDIPLTFCAARDYLVRRGTPRRAEDLAAHDLVGYDRSPLLEEGFRQGGLDVGRAGFATRCDDNMAYFALVRAGCGIGIAQTTLVTADPDLVALDLGVAVPHLPLWLTAHEATRTTPRVAHVWGRLVAGLSPLCRSSPDLDPAAKAD
jgi:DNA-binding transcriptional LysR family regulator